MKTIIIASFLTLFSTLIHANTSIKKLRFIADYNFSSSHIFKGSKFGGLSGLAYDSEQNLLIAISDDRGSKKNKKKNAPRLYFLDISVNAKEAHINPRKKVILKFADEDQFPYLFLDPEGIALMNDKTILISSEGYVPIIPPMLMNFDQKGNFIKQISIPEKFIPLKPGNTQTQGVQYNAAFESLAISPDKSTAVIANEYALKQDNEQFARLLFYNLKSLKTKEYIYPLQEGLVDLTFIDNSQLLAVERGWNPISKKNRILIYQVDTTQATDVSTKFAVTKSTGIKIAQKTLLMDLDEIIPYLSKKYRRLDNIEGITIGPKLQNGNSTLILVSDNNFSKHQRTLFLVFEIISSSQQ